MRIRQVIKAAWKRIVGLFITPKKLEFVDWADRFDTCMGCDYSMKSFNINGKEIKKPATCWHTGEVLANKTELINEKCPDGRWAIIK
jgi:hypothetical protein